MSRTASGKLLLGTRGSALAIAQSESVRQQISTSGVACELKVITTTGDVQLAQPLPELGGKGVFTAELESALLDGAIDLAVHSLKDLPTAAVRGVEMAAVLGREDAADAVVSCSRARLHELPAGAVIGTSSLRRSAQLRAYRADLELRPIRGNVDTRIRKTDAGEYDAVVLAAAGLLRLGLMQRASERLAFEVMLPAPGQGALAVQCRSDDPDTIALLRALDEPEVRAAVTAERHFLERLGGGCAAPIGAYAVARGVTLSMQALVASADGAHIVRVAGTGSDPHALAAMLADQAVQRGAQELLE